jgi:hypothetical protein
LKHTGANWQIYAAVTGSALAMATNASAGVIYSGIQNITAGPISATGGHVHSQTSHQSSFKKIGLKNATGAPIGRGFSVGAYQRFVLTYPGVGMTSHVLNGDAAVKTAGVGFFTGGPDLLVLDFALGAKISSSQGHGGTLKFASQSVGPHGTSGKFGWQAGKTGFAGFDVSTAGHKEEVGWVRLEYTLGANGLANSVEAIDWAYNGTPGASINAGEGIPPSPEPSTGALALLATGAAGVAFLRRRRKTAV